MRLILQVRAICRRMYGGDKDLGNELYDALLDGGEHADRELAMAAVEPLLECRLILQDRKKRQEKRLAELVPRLPVYPWVAETKCLGAVGLSQIVTEAGDLWRYDNPAKLWKRLGLGMVNRPGSDGTVLSERQRRVSGDAALEHGFSPRRRSVMYCIGESLVKRKGPYRDVYLARKAEEVEKAGAAGLTVVPSAKITAKNRHLHRSKGHVHARARRYMEKRLLRDLWRQWRHLTPRPPAESKEESVP